MFGRSVAGTGFVILETEFPELDAIHQCRVHHFRATKGEDDHLESVIEVGVRIPAIERGIQGRQLL